MKFSETKLKGVFVIEPERIVDERGFFARSWSVAEFSKQGLEVKPVQASVSFNAKKGTLRGLHYQAEPHSETKLIRCTRGAIFDVVVDIRPSSPTYKKWVSVELNAENRCLLFVPKGFAHGFQTLEDNSEVFYEISPEYVADSARGLRWNDPTLDIHWPLEVTLISDRDKAFPILGK